MAHQMLRAQQHVFHYQSFHINKSQPLGHGSYGAVYKAKCDQLPCAAKVLHPTILDPTDPGAGKIMERFQQECAFLESIRHPNIVQYLGITRDPESGLPVLLMELLDESLTKMLERSQQSLAYYVQVDICHDIALAVAYLHSSDIIHRDLSSNNVLMITGRRAKVTDFGMSKLAGAAPSMTPLTMCPGTQAYMPPEALREPPRYTKKLDCFSEGVIMIQVCTLLWPEPGPRTQIVEDSRSPMGIMEMPVSEIERRKNHIDLIDPSHALLSIAKNCMCFQEKDRISSEEVCQRLAGLKESREYREIICKDEFILLTQQLQEKDRMLCKKDNEILSKDQQVQDKDKALQQKVNKIHEQDKLLQQKERQLQEEIASRETQLRQLNQMVDDKEKVVAEIEQTNYTLQKQVARLQKQLSRKSRKPPQPPPPYQPKAKGRQLQEREPPQPPPPYQSKAKGLRQLQERESLKQLPSLQVDHRPHPHRPSKITMNWSGGGKAPFAMERGAAVVDGIVAYFMNYSSEVCSYSSATRDWSKLRKCPYQYSSLAVINGQLTAIGGCKNLYSNDTYTNELLCLHESWIDVFPPMATKRRGTTAMVSKEHLIVAGGATGPYPGDRSSTVEVMDTKTLVWSTVASLPHPYTRASASICGDQLYMLGGWDDHGETKSVLTCSLTELLQSSSSSIWHRVADAPAYLSTCAVVNGELLAVGGCDKDDKPTAAIHKYSPTTNSWDLISNMLTARYHCLVAVLPNNEMMVVNVRHHDKVEIASINISFE